MITIKVDYYGEDKEVIQDLICLVNSTINDFCVDHKQAYVVLNNANMMAIAKKKTTLLQE